MVIHLYFVCISYRHFITVQYNCTIFTHILIQWVPWALSTGVKWLGHEADHSPPSSTKLKNAGSYTFTPQYVYMAWCLIKQWICILGMVLS